MSYDPLLADRLAALPTERFIGEVFRATRLNADATAPSLYGGRWAVPQNGDPGTNVLYTSLTRDGAMAEIAAFLLDLTPIPGPRELKVTRLNVTASRTLHLARADLANFGVEMNRYGERDYSRTQEIGSTLAWMGLDGLIAPSARWNCDNLMIFSDNHSFAEKLDIVDHELIEWRQWAVKAGLLEAS